MFCPSEHVGLFVDGYDMIKCLYTVRGQLK